MAFAAPTDATHLGSGKTRTAFVNCCVSFIQMIQPIESGLNVPTVFQIQKEALTMNLPDRDGDGYLTDMSAWTEEIGRAMAEADGYELDDAKWAQDRKSVV